MNNDSYTANELGDKPKKINNCKTIEIMKKFLLEIKQDFNNIPNSVKFWNLLVLIGLILSGVFSIDLLMCELVVGSMLTLALVIDDNEDNHIWMIFMPITWLGMLFVGVIVSVELIYTKIIKKFNNWLDKEK
jgi:hypothetical protein